MPKEVKRVNRNPFIHFLKEFRKANPNRRQAELFREAGNLWRQMSQAEKRKYYIGSSSVDNVPSVTNSDTSLGFQDAEPQDDLLPDILKRAPTLREAPFWEVRRHKTEKSPGWHRTKLFNSFRTVGITIIICCLTYIVSKL